MSKQLLENMEQLQTFSPAESLIVPAEKPAKHVYEAFVGNHKIVIETGHLAKQAGGAVTARMGDTMVLATATMAKTPRQGIDFFPLNVE
ncbi:MAG: hypothetical protein N2545_10000, partial [Thermoflexales bacterium]|nr:hypothetical protein [Thermoflexales bacterium]